MLVQADFIRMGRWCGTVITHCEEGENPLEVIKARLKDFELWPADCELVLKGDKNAH